ncbi:four helix bundle protein [Candidatus Velamenicoccus archaeovorus]|nr:four helix bundle protein [Candidatus Velamenicoccus archaeovorus]
MGLVETAYQITGKFPKGELFGLTNQLRRSSVSIPSNIAEGFLRQHANEMIQFLYIALGSCGELDTQTEISYRLRYITENQKNLLSEDVDHIARMIRNLIKSLRNRTTKHEERTTS